MKRNINWRKFSRSLPFLLASVLARHAFTAAKALRGLAEPRTAKSEAFDWFRHWYPVTIPDTLDPEKPHETQILGIDVVIWTDGAWRVSESGRGQGPGRQLPSKIVDEILWVFPYRGLDAFEEAEKVALPLCKELHDPALKDDWSYILPGGIRDFPCGWDALAENCLDPAHFCAAHHGIIGNRYKDPAPYEYKMTEPLDLEDGFALNGDLGKLEFRPPCLVKYHPNSQSMPFRGNIILATYCVPMSPGNFRVVAVVLQNKAGISGGTIAERLLSLFNMVPKWVGHMLTPVVVHQDSGLLYGTYRNLREKGYRPGLEGSAKYGSLVYCPTAVDAGPMAFRRWMQLAGGDVPWACEDVLPARGSEDLFDVWEAHTKQCRYCMDAYNNLELLKYVSAAVFCVTLLLMTGSERATLASLSAALAAALHLVTGPNGPFRRWDFAHHENNWSAPWQ
mmetsp:Transcript_26367/g.47520  ORF Transcript_26367/g.47520 Transcript_26367/m.47520 type:complete len:450 (+) Transcript_26367:62-1411(+)